MPPQEKVEHAAPVQVAQPPLLPPAPPAYTRRQKERAALREKLATGPRVLPKVVPPISPADLIKAREAFLARRRAKYPPAKSEPATVQPSAWPGMGSGNEFAPLGGPIVVASAHLVPGAQVQLVSAKAKKQAAAKPHHTQLASRGATAPAAQYRGGSPRDRAAQARKNLANQALSYRGMPYIRGAASPSRGFDCSGLVYFLLRQRGYNPPRTAAGYAHFGTSVAKKDLKPGDLLLFANTYKHGISHIGVYLGNGKFVHAATAREGVRVDSLSKPYYSHKYYGARRVP
jgi:cell wall-associated NlpC family hydrolase